MRSELNTLSELRFLGSKQAVRRTETSLFPSNKFQENEKPTVAFSSDAQKNKFQNFIIVFCFLVYRVFVSTIYGKCGTYGIGLFKQIIESGK